MNTPQKTKELILLVRPHPFRFEGPRGYLVRVAEANWMPYQELEGLGVIYEYESLISNGLLLDQVMDPDLHEHVNNLSQLLNKYPRVWNHKYSRFCPLCLSEDAFWRTGWELLFHDACPQHGVWLIDQCASCGKKLSWNRDYLVRCQCGSDLRAEVTSACPENVTNLANLLSKKLHHSQMQKFPIPFEKTNIEQTQRLIRYAGAHLNPESERNPLKIHQIGNMTSSWPITSLAAEILFNWPEAFQHSFQKIQSSTDDTKARRLNSVFGHAYHYLYRGLQDAAFNPVRQAFESWLSSSWRGGLAKRNKRLALLILDKATWIPGSLAREALGISNQRLLHLIREHVIEGEISYSKAGRQFVMIRRDQLELARDALNGSIDMKTAGGLLGLTKRRMRQILRLLFPNARKIGEAASMPWSVSRAEVEQVLEITQQLLKVSIPDEGSVSIEHILRYWAWTTHEIATLINAAGTGEVEITNVLEGNVGISSWIFQEYTLKAWKAKSTQGFGTWLTVSQMAKLLNIKEQVAYDLVRKHFVNGEALHNHVKGGVRINRSEVEKFKQSFIFCTEVAQALGVSSRKARSILLADFYIEPISGPGIDDSRQLLYFRNEPLKSAIETLLSKEKNVWSLI